MRRAARTDANQPAVVKALRAIGATVYPTHMVGNGFPDLVVGFRGNNYLIEIKDGAKVPSKRILTPDEQEFFDTWRGSVFVIESEQQAIEFFNP